MKLGTPKQYKFIKCLSIKKGFNSLYDAISEILGIPTNDISTTVFTAEEVNKIIIALKQHPGVDR